MPFLSLYRLVFTDAPSQADALSEPLLPQSDSSCTDIDNCRKLVNIIWSCVTTIFACTWLTLHPNIPPILDTRNVGFGQKCLHGFKRFLRHRLLPFLVAVIAPEWILAWAMQQRIVADQIAKRGGPLWTRTHGFFVIMGGFHAFSREEAPGPSSNPPPVTLATPIANIRSGIGISEPTATRPQRRPEMASGATPPNSPPNPLHRQSGGSLPFTLENLRNFNTQTNSNTPPKLSALPVFNTPPNLNSRPPNGLKPQGSPSQQNMRSVTLLQENSRRPMMLPRFSESTLGASSSTLHSTNATRLLNRDPGKPFYPLSQDSVLLKFEQGGLILPLLEEIQDKNKTDWLGKFLVMLQIGWFFSQCVARGVGHLKLSELEVVTLAYTIMNIGIYIAWWDKPRNVDRPLRVFIPKETAQHAREQARKGRRVPRDWKGFLAYVVSFLAPGIPDRIDLAGLTCVPTFHSGKPHKAANFLMSAFVSSGIGVVFGAIHCIAWSYPFASRTERFLWRFSSAAMIGVPFFVFAAGATGVLGDMLHNYRARSRFIEPFLRFLLSLIVFFASTVLVFGPLLYVFARLVTFVLAFKTLSSLPPDAFRTIPWTKWIPHI
ncbi:hypothetical protein CPB86DRAFT_791636 [Serendipita vermifera]|nr:hypothetical protein CPB86DRAFT_791636 [Serendipita vermifera]